MVVSRSLFGAALLLLVVEIILISPNHIGAPEKAVFRPIEAADVKKLDQVMKGVHLMDVLGDNRNWELKANEAKAFRGRGDWGLEKIKTTFFGKNGVNFFVRGKKGGVSMDTKDMHVEGDVLTKTSNRYELRSDSVHYEAKIRELNTDSNVNILGPKDKEGNRLRLRGEGMQVKVDEGQMKVHKNVRGEMSLQNGKVMKIQSDSVLLSGKSYMAHFKGNVIIDVDTLRVTGPGALFQYESGRNTLSSVFVDGGVKVSDIDKFATSKNVKVHFKENKFVFRGNPRLVQDDDELFGDKIVFLDGGKKVDVKGAKAKIRQERATGEE
jgi:LPS export ABC transporter protein LptC